MDEKMRDLIYEFERLCVFENNLFLLFLTFSISGLIIRLPPKNFEIIVFHMFF